MSFLDRIRIAKHLRVLRAASSVPPESLREAKEALREAGEASLAGLLELLPRPESREVAGEVLESMLSDVTLPRYVEALAAPDRAVSKEIVAILSRARGYDPAILVEALSRPEIPNHRLESILRAREDLSARDLLKILPDLARDSRTIVARLLEDRVGPDSWSEVARLATHSDWWLRHRAGGLLARIPGEDSAEALIRLVKDPNKNVRLVAIRSLRTLEARSAVKSLTEALRDPDLTVQAAAIDALVALGDASAVPFLVDVLQDESEQSRRAAVEVLNEVANEEAVKDLVQALRDADWWVRVRAADALGTLGGPKVVEAVLGLMGDEDIHLRRYAVEILNTVPDGRAVDPLIRALDDEDWWVRERSIDALSRPGAEKAVVPLVALMAGNDEAAPLCARALATLGFPAAVEPLVVVLGSSPSDELRLEATRALEALVKTKLPDDLLQMVETALRDTGRRVERTRLKPMAIRAGAAAVGADRPSGSGEVAGPADPRQGGIEWNLSSERAAPPSPAPARPQPPSTASAAGGEGPSSRSPSSTPAPFLRTEDVVPGMVLLDRYEIRRKIGSGGFATVFLASDRVISEEVILKILSHHLSTDEKMRLRFVQELKLARRISHPHVIRIHDLLEIGDAKAISMEYFEGRDLGKVLDDRERLPVDRVLRISRQVAEGLAAAHDVGVVHRDVKPGNILVGDADEVKLLDFGLASATHEVSQRLTKTGHLVGTPHYMAPELIRSEEVDGRADLYSFGIVMYEMLSGRLPYDGDNPMSILFRHLDGDATPLAELVPDLPAEILEIVDRLIAVDREARPADARALAGLLGEAGA